MADPIIPKVVATRAGDYTDPGAGEHVISYAYPSSPRAEALGHGQSGCYVVRVAGAGAVARASYQDCLAHVEPLGTRPGRWSMDHPAHAHMLPAAHVGIGD
jgi:hypothetical protein